MNVTYNQVALFRKNARNFLAQKGLEMSKLCWALNKMLARTETVHQQYKDAEEGIRIDLAEVDKTTSVLLCNGPNNSYSYNKANAKSLTDKLRVLGNTVVEIEPHIASELPKNLEPIWYEFFIPFVIAEQADDTKPAE